MKTRIKNPVKQLLAVAVLLGATGVASADAPRTLASARPACGNTMGKGGPRSECQWRKLIWDARAGVARAEHERILVADLVASPLLLANGRPACGNTGGKSRGSCRQAVEREREDKLDAAMREAEIQRSALARILEDYERWSSREQKLLASR